MGQNPAKQQKKEPDESNGESPPAGQASKQKQVQDNNGLQSSEMFCVCGELSSTTDYDSGTFRDETSVIDHNRREDRTTDTYQTMATGNASITDYDETIKKLLPQPMTCIYETPEGMISTTQLFNSMNDGQLSPYIFDPTFLLLIDARDLETYNKEHIVTALHVSKLNDSTLVSPFDSYTLIVIYGNTGEAQFNKEEIFVKTLATLQKQHVTDAYVLQGGFQEFSARFPFLCTDKIIHSGRERQELIGNYPSVVLEGKLYLGRGDQAVKKEVKANLSITHIVNITLDHPCAFPGDIKYMCLMVDDVSRTNLIRHFEETYNFIDNAIENGGTVMVHCNLGVSRSATVVAAYLMKKKRWVLKDTFEFLKERRPIVSPNRGFCKQLAQYEKIVFCLTSLPSTE